MRLLCAACILLLCAAPILAAETTAPADPVRITLPLEGFYRPGKYIPVAVDARLPDSAPGDILEIAAEGAVPTRIELASGVATGVAPFLIVQDPRNAAWQIRKADGTIGLSGTIPADWRRLDPSQRIILVNGSNIFPVHQQLAPGPIIPIRSDRRLNPQQRGSAAWECLDGVVDERNDFHPIPRATIVGPTASADWPAALSAVQGWHADWPPSFRRRILLYAAIFSLIALAVAAFMRPHWLATLTIVFISLSVCAALLVWWRNRPPVLERRGDIIVTRSPDTDAQYDSWRFFASANTTPVQIHWEEDLTRPFFESPEQRRAARLLLNCDYNCEPRSFFLLLTPGLKAGILSRTWAPAPDPAVLKPATSPELVLHATRLYLAPDTSIAGQVPPRSPSTSSILEWPGVVLKHAP